MKLLLGFVLVATAQQRRKGTTRKVASFLKLTHCRSLDKARDPRRKERGDRSRMDIEGRGDTNGISYISSDSSAFDTFLHTHTHTHTRRKLKKCIFLSFITTGEGSEGVTREADALLLLYDC